VGDTSCAPDCELRQDPLYNRKEGGDDDGVLQEICGTGSRCRQTLSLSNAVEQVPTLEENMTARSCQDDRREVDIQLTLDPSQKVTGNGTNMRASRDVQSPDAS